MPGAIREEPHRGSRMSIRRDGQPSRT
jgi:hypothetical protein